MPVIATLRRSLHQRAHVPQDLQTDEFVVTTECTSTCCVALRRKLRCRAEVLKPGRRLAVVEAQVWADDAGREVLVAKLNATMAVVTQR